MHVIVCLDDKEGMLFHGRRQSRDREVVGEILKRTKGRRLWMSPYSQPLFQGRMDGLLVDEGFLDKAAPGDFCFVEGLLWPLGRTSWNPSHFTVGTAITQGMYFSI